MPMAPVSLQQSQTAVHKCTPPPHASSSSSSDVMTPPDVPTVSGLKRRRSPSPTPPQRIIGKALIRNHMPAEQTLLGEAKKVYWGLLGALNPYAEGAEKGELIQDALRTAQKERRLDIPLKATHSAYLSQTTSKFRTRIVEAARAAVKSHYITPFVISKGVENLLDGMAFIYQDASDQTSRIFRSPALTEVINGVWFRDKDALGIAMKALYHPVRFETIAIAAAAVEWALEEWKSGTLEAKDWRSIERWRYEDHLATLHSFKSKKANASATLQVWMFEQACAHARVTSKDLDQTRGGRIPSSAFDHEEDDD
ncbi:hypothetical protein CALCODRAFT_487253 [Calocera cornea HHB12733]|uniref:DUF6532 domain-containing protein n=1 Tax=Calocera cornea HHB12733 TaxID=1353952 RepID=A0A165D8T0_9BASI|nr:hypothetical protein CALCODRAFT_487253 [Calocera cornea HHB12733]